VSIEDVSLIFTFNATFAFTLSMPFCLHALVDRVVVSTNPVTDVDADNVPLDDATTTLSPVPARLCNRHTPAEDMLPLVALFVLNDIAPAVVLASSMLSPVCHKYPLALSLRLNPRMPPDVPFSSIDEVADV
jgi:hypothetical protein